MTPTKSSTSNPTTQAPITSSSTATSTVPSSYASAAKVASSPAIATSSSSQSPAVAVGNVQPVQQNGKASSISPVNGRAPPAVPVVSTPAVAHSNGDHSRKGSVTIAQGFPNGGPVGGASSKIQFGSLPDSPAITNSTPQIAHSTSSAPIPIPNQNPRIVSPAQSPSPIPQAPQVSGGARPLQSGSAQPSGMVFGSLNSNGDGDRSRQPAGPPHTPVLPQGHMRQSSAQDMNGPTGNIGGRGGFQQGGRGRGGAYNGYGNNNNMGYNNMGPGGPQYRGGQNQARGGGMPPPFQSQGRPPMNQYSGSPHQAARSPALANAMPGTPNMGQSMPMQPQQPYYGQMQQYPQVNSSNSLNNPNLRHKSGKGKKNKNNGSRGTPNRERRDSGSEYYAPRQNGGGRRRNSNVQTDNFHHQYSGTMNREFPEQLHFPQPNNQQQQFELYGCMPLAIPNPVFATDRQFLSQSSSSSLHGQAQAFKPRKETVNRLRDESIQPRAESLKMDLSPSGGNFERLRDAAIEKDSLVKAKLNETILTSETEQNAYGYPAFDRATGMPIQQNPYQMYPMNYPQMNQMAGPPPQSPQQGYQNMTTQQAPYVPGQYATGAQPMSRSSSQVSERPNSSMGPQPPAMPPAVIQAQQPSKPATPASFTRPGPRKSAAIQIKNPDGEVVEIHKLPQKGPPASPAPSARTSTPPVVVSTPTPPPKSMTPQVVRTDSPAAKTAEQKISEFKSQISKAVSSDSQVTEAKAAEEEAAKAAEAEAAKQKEAAELKAKEEAESKTKADAEAKAKEEAEAQAKKDADAKAEAEAAAAAQPDEEEEMERAIREMEEEDARREAAAAEYEAKRKAQREIAKAQEEANKKVTAEEADRKLKEAERAMEALEDEKERKRLAAEKGEELTPEVSKTSPPATAPKTLASKLSSMTLANDSTPSSPSASDDGTMGPPPPKLSPAGEKRAKPAALNLAPLNTKPVEAPQPSAALQSLKSARFLTVLNSEIYPPGISSPNPALNPAVAAKGKSFKYDKEFLLQFQKVFTEKPSLEFESQIKALIGDGESGSARPGGSARPSSGMAPRQNSNRNAPGNFAMGTFGVPAGGKTLPPGTTSQERFLMSSGAIARPQSQSFGRPGAGFSGNSMNRVPSSSHMGNQVPQSPRQGNNRSQRNNSKRADTNKDDAKAAKTMPLTAGMDLKPIAVTAGGWKPSSIGKAATGAAGPTPGAAGGHMQPDMVQRKVKAALNKMTPDNFDRISDQILVIAAQSKDEQDGRTLRQVIQLTFEKATDEAHWASMYAKFCKRMLETMSPEIRDEGILDKNGNVVSGGNLFRKYLLNRCQEEFERGWKLELPDKPEGERGEEKSEEAVMLSDDYYIAAAAKRRGLGLVQFIGELYKLNMLTERIMHECVKKLVDYTSMPDEAEIESLTKLLKTIGGNLDSTEKGKPMMDVYFGRIQNMIEIPDLPSRLQFMLMDIVDLRRKGWRSKEDNKGPKTLDEVRAEAEAAAAQKAADNARPQRGGGGSRMQMGRGDSRNYGNQFAMPPPDHNRNTVGMDDLRRLQGNKSNRQTSGPGVFGPSSMFANRSSSGRKMGSSMRGTGDNSGASSRTGTPPQQSSANAFSLLADMSNSEGQENPASPPTSNATPATNAENDS